MKIQTELSIWHLDEDRATLCPFMMDHVKGQLEVGVLEEIIEKWSTWHQSANQSIVRTEYGFSQPF